MFLESAYAYMEPLKGTHIHRAICRDYLEKTGNVESGYARWLRDLFAHLIQRYGLHGKRVLDFGCGTGELTVRMRSLGYEAYGFDMHERHLSLARILAKENDVPAEAFILNKPNGHPDPRLPFPDGSFDIITLFSVLEHISDPALRTLLPEFRRVCRGVIYVLVPNRLKAVDDHTGLRYVCWAPRCVAVPYVGLRGHSNGYHISSDGTWDVYNRTFPKIKSVVKRYGFRVDFPPDEYAFPSSQKPVTQVAGSARGLRPGRIIPLLWHRVFNPDCPPQGLYPYLNMIWSQKGNRGL